jgi:exodeoxyribonuclease VII large subunit
MLRILSARWPCRVLVYPVRVQGEGAAEDIARAIDHINRDLPFLDAMIVGRGGGSIEDLWAFNEEVVARAIARSRIPVVSAVGHESDTTIADLVADVRAATPTHAASTIVPDRRDVEARLADLGAKLSRLLRDRARLARAQLDRLRDSAALHEPGRLVHQHQQRCDELSERLVVGLRNAAHAARRTLDTLAARLGARSPAELLRQRRRDIERLERSADLAARRAAAAARQRAAAAAAHLEAVSPLAVLKRGYSVTRDARGRVITDPGHVKPGDVIDSRVAKGSIRSKVQ